MRKGFCVLGIDGRISSEKEGVAGGRKLGWTGVEDVVTMGENKEVQELLDRAG